MKFDYYYSKIKNKKNEDFCLDVVFHSYKSLLFIEINING